MSVRERAYNIFLNLTEEQFVNMFGQGNLDSSTAVDKLRGILKDVQDRKLLAESSACVLKVCDNGTVQGFISAYEIIFCNNFGNCFHPKLFLP